MKVLVVGAGPTGLTAALELARNGVKPRIVERRSAPSELSRAVGIMPETIEKLRPSGVGDAIVREAMPLRKVTVNRAETKLMSLDFTDTDLRDQTLLGLPQTRTESLMRDALAEMGVEVEFECAVSEIETDNTEAVVTFSDGASDTYDWVIAADGLQSTIREQLGIAYPGKDLPGKWSIADVDLGGGYDPEQFTAWIQQGDSGAFTFIIPIEKKRLRIVSSTDDAIGSLPVTLDIQKVRRTAIFEISVRQAETYQRGRVLLAGDAAHCHSPVGGKGMNLGIDDAVSAANAILTSTTEQYTQNRHSVGKGVLKKSESARKIVSARNPIIKLAVTLVTFAIDRSALLQSGLMRNLTRL